MSAHDVVPVALTRYCVFVSCGELSCEPYKKGEWADYDEAQATVDALQKRIDELTRVSRELCNVDRLHDLIDETFLTAHGELYE